MNFSGLAFLRPPAFQEILNPVKFTQIPKSLMETKGGLVIFCWKVGRLPAFWNAARPKKNLLWAKSCTGGFGKTSQNKPFQGKKKPLKIVLKLSPSLEEEGSHLLFICLSPCPLKEKGAGGLFLSSCSCCRCKQTIFPKAGWSFVCWDSCGNLCLHQLWENRTWREFWDQEIICGWPNESWGSSALSFQGSHQGLSHREVCKD